MKRKIYQKLLEWKNNPRHKPLVLLGARQVGKTYILKEFGKKEFNNFVYVNCHNNPFASSLFSDFNIKRILYQLEQDNECNIIPGKTLLFFDEIQEVKNGIPALKYFCEENRELHVVVAGSMLGVSLREDESYPVRKIETFRMYPMTFEEFLQANGRERLADSLREMQWEELSIHHETLVEYLRQYYFTGGMPEAVSTWIDGHNARETRNVQRAILSTYFGDMGKHTKTEVERIRTVWDIIPSQMAKEKKKFIFGAVKKGARAAEYEKSLQWLADSGLIYKVCRISKPEEPLKFYADTSAFKVFLHDVGLLACLCGARSSEMLLGMGAFTEFKGAFTENYVMNQIKSLEDSDVIGNEIFYYSKESSPLEVDFVVQGGKRVVPVEVKAEHNVRSKSLTTFVNQEFSSYSLKALRCSMMPYADQQWMENIPLYAVEAFFSKEGVGIEV